MKKKWIEPEPGFSRFKKMLLAMRLTLFLMTVAVFSTNAATYGQRTKLDLNIKDRQIREILNQIEDQTEYSFMYDNNQLDVSKRVSVDMKSSTIENILNEIFKESGVTYKIIDRHIMLYPKEQTIAVQQPKAVSGKVTDSSGSPLPGVTVVVKGTTHGTITDASGNYSLPNVSGDATLMFSFVGMKVQEIAVSGKNFIQVVMQEETVGIEEVVAIGYGTQKKVNLTGSVSSISGEKLNKRPVPNVAQMLQGKLAGVEITQYTGEPGAEGINIRIRGLNSFGTSNTPIVLVDGFEGNLSNLDPNNIESISVLKDASSAAIYGSRAANGVILVSTKRGEAGKSSLTYSANFATHQATRLPELVNDPVKYMEMFNTASINSGTGVSYPQSIIDKYKSGELKGYNWDDVFWKKAFVQNHNLTLTGGTQKLKYNFGLNYWDQPGVLHGFNYKEYKVLFNIDSEISQYISFGASVNFSQGNRKGTHDGESNEIICWAANAPTYGPKLPDGRYTWSAYTWEVHNANPVANYENGGTWTDSYYVQSNAYLKVTPFNGLTWQTNGGVKYTNSLYKRRVPVIPTYDFYTGEPRNVIGSNDGQLTENQTSDILYSLFSTLNYSKTIEDHTFSILIGTSLDTYKNNYLAGFRKGFPNNDLTELNAAGTTGQTTNGTAYEWALGSYFGRINYNFKNRYFFEANARMDGSSRFPSGDRYGFFPSFSAGWRISEEEFLKDLKWAQNLKIRASWGQLGNQAIGNYPYQDLLSIGWLDYAFGSTLSSGAAQTRLSNKSIRWETTTIFDAGFDFNMKNNLISLTCDYFNKTTNDILRPGQVLGSVGLDGPTINNGKMRNTGYEITIGHNYHLGDFKYSIDLNFSHFKNELVSFGAKEISDRTIKQEGIPYDSWYLNEWDGIFQSQDEINSSPVHYYAVRPGTIKIKDVNNDVKANLDDRVVVDGRYPKFNYGLNLNLEWKQFDLSAFFQGVNGIKYYVMQWGLEPFSQGSRPPVKWIDAWTLENHSNTLPYLYFADRETSNRQNSTFWLMDGSYLRLKNLQAGYNISRSVIGKIGLTEARIYISGDNLFTFTKFEGFDPERDPNQTRFGEYPQLKIYSMGIKVKF